MKDCRDCKNSTKSYNQWLCLAFNTPKPTSWMRDDRNECGLNATMFEPKDERRYAEADDL